jgi:hypothetical protein
VSLSSSSDSTNRDAFDLGDFLVTVALWLLLLVEKNENRCSPAELGLRSVFRIVAVTEPEEVGRYSVGESGCPDGDRR